jgi:hypothetical protein
LPSYPRFQAGIYPKERQLGFPITTVGNDGDRERFPITLVGNDLSGYLPQIAGMTLEVLLNKKKEVGCTG